MPRWPRQSVSTTQDLQGPSPPKPVLSLERRTAVLEEGMEICDERLDAMSYQVKVLLGQVNIMNRWIKEKYGAQPINEESPHFKGLNIDLDEMEEITSSLRNSMSPEMVALPDSKPQETQVTQASAPEAEAGAGSRRNQTRQRISSAMDVCMSESTDKQKKVIIVDSDSSESSDDEEHGLSTPEVLSEDDGIDSDVSDLMIDMMLGKTVADADKERLKRFYNKATDQESKTDLQFPSETSNPVAVVIATCHTDYEQNRSIQTKAAKKSFPGLNVSPKPCPKSRKGLFHKGNIKTEARNFGQPSPAKNHRSQRENTSPKTKSKPFSTNSALNTIRTKRTPLNSTGSGAGRRILRNYETFQKLVGLKTRGLNSSFSCKYCHQKFGQLSRLWCHIKSKHSRRTSWTKGITKEGPDITLPEVQNARIGYGSEATEAVSNKKSQLLQEHLYEGGKIS